MGQQVSKALAAHSGSIDGLCISVPQHLKEIPRQMRKKVFCSCMRNFSQMFNSMFNLAVNPLPPNKTRGSPTLHDVVSLSCRMTWPREKGPIRACLSWHEKNTKEINTPTERRKVMGKGGFFGPLSYHFFLLILKSLPRRHEGYDRLFLWSSTALARLSAPPK
jgi:hypothetical protein